jgi:hypothetical protein
MQNESSLKESEGSLLTLFYLIKPASLIQKFIKDSSKLHWVRMEHIGINPFCNQGLAITLPSRKETTMKILRLFEDGWMSVRLIIY